MQYQNQIVMKQKFILSLFFVCTLLTTSYAQINKGAIWLGSNISYSQNKDYPDQQPVERKTRSLIVTPAFGLAIKDNLVVGIFGKYTDTNKDNDEGYDNQNEKSYGGGLFVRRYVPVFKRFYIFGEGRIGYFAFKEYLKWSGTGVSSSNSKKGWETSLNISPGISYGITKNVQLEAGFVSLFEATYRSSKNTGLIEYAQYPAVNTENTTRSFSTGIKLENVSQFFIGVRFLINNNNKG